MAGETGRFRSPENISTAAILIAILSGGGGLTMNSWSNSAVMEKLDKVSNSITRIEEDRKSITQNFNRIDAMLIAQAKTIADDHDEISALKVKIAVLETKVK